jgi:hypothetical protein
MRVCFWVKFADTPPERWADDTFEALWHRLREAMLRHHLRLEWLIEGS